MILTFRASGILTDLENFEPFSIPFPFSPVNFSGIAFNTASADCPINIWGGGGSILLATVLFPAGQSTPVLTCNASTWYAGGGYAQGPVTADATLSLFAFTFAG